MCQLLHSLVDIDNTAFGSENMDTRQRKKQTMAPFFNHVLYHMAGIHYPRIPRTAVGNPLYNYYRCQDDKWIIL